MKKEVNLEKQQFKLNKNIFKNKKFVKLIIALFGLATLLSYVVGFVQEYVTPFYGDSISLGFGLIMWSITSLLWIPSTHSNKISWQRIALPIIAVVSACLLPTILTFVMSGIFLILVGAYYLIEDNLD